MLGPGTKLKEMTADEQGCIPRAMDQLFEALETSDKYTSWKMQLSYIEVYMDKIYDLLRTPGTAAAVEGDVIVAKDGVARLKHITPTPVESLQVGAPALGHPCVWLCLSGQLTKWIAQCFGIVCRTWRP